MSRLTQDEVLSVLAHLRFDDDGEESAQYGTVCAIEHAVTSSEFVREYGTYARDGLLSLLTRRAPDPLPAPAWRAEITISDQRGQGVSIREGSWDKVWNFIIEMMQVYSSEASRGQVSVSLRPVVAP